MRKETVRKNTKVMQETPAQLLLSLSRRIAIIESTLDPYTGIVEEEEHLKFIVYHKPLRIYTVIGAKNIHHAFNKATKLFKGEFSGLYRNSHNTPLVSLRFVSVADFNQLLNKDPELPENGG